MDSNLSYCLVRFVSNITFFFKLQSLTSYLCEVNLGCENEEEIESEAISNFRNILRIPRRESS